MPELVVSPTGSTNASVVASDGSLYTTLALMAAAGKVAFPGLDAGAHPRTLTIKSTDGSDADGSPFYWATNRASAPASTAMEFCSGSGQAFSIEGHDLLSIYVIDNIWVKLTSASDTLRIRIDY